MGVVVKQGFWGTFISYAGVLIGYVNTLILTPAYLDLDQIGIFRLIIANAMMLSPIASFGLPASFIRFFPTLKGNYRNDLFTFFLLITVLFNLLILSTGLLLRDLIGDYYVDKAPEYINYFSVTAMILAMNSFFDIFYSYSRSILKIVLPTAVREIYLRICTVVLVVLYGLEVISFTEVAYGLGFLYVTAVLILVTDLFFNKGLRISFKWDFLDKKWLKPVFSFSFFTMLLTLSFAITNNISYNQVTSILGNAQNGIYTTCFFIGVIVEMPRRNMAKVITPLISPLMANKSYEKIKSINQKTSITMSVIGCLIFIGIITNINDLFLFIPKGESFEEGYRVIVAVCTTKLVIMLSGVPGEIIALSDYYRVNLVFQLSTAILLMGLNEFLIPLMGLDGVALAFLLSMLLLTGCQVLFVHLKFNNQPFQINHLKLFLISFIVGTLAFLFQINTNPILSIAIRSILTSLLFGFLIFRFKISSDINHLIRSIFERLAIKLNKQ